MGMWEAAGLCLTSRAPTETALSERLASHFSIPPLKCFFCLLLLLLSWWLIAERFGGWDKSRVVKAVGFSAWHTLGSWVGAIGRRVGACDVTDSCTVRVPVSSILLFVKTMWPASSERHGAQFAYAPPLLQITVSRRNSSKGPQKKRTDALERVSPCSPCVVTDEDVTAELKW